MSERISTELGFIDFFLGMRPNKNDFLDKVDELIDWKPIEKLLKRHYRKTASADGRPAYPPLPMFKMLLLQRWYNLSDPALEAAMYDRISFIRFAGLSFDSSVPDETTICRFRNALKDSGLDMRLLRQINKQLEKRDLLVRGGAIVDATIVSSCRRPRKVIEVVPEDRREDEAVEAEGAGAKVEFSDDEDARWIKKGKRSSYGYKAHIATDVNGFVLCGHATGANRSDTKEFERVVEGAGLPEGAFVLADKGYAGEPNRQVLAERRLVNGIMGKASRGNPLTFFDRLRNRIISGCRFVVEQSAGIMKHHYGFSRARYKGIGKVELELHLIAMALNIKKGVGLSSA